MYMDMLDIMQDTCTERIRRKLDYRPTINAICYMLQLLRLVSYFIHEKKRKDMKHKPKEECPRGSQWNRKEMVKSHHPRVADAHKKITKVTYGPDHNDSNSLSVYPEWQAG